MGVLSSFAGTFLKEDDEIILSASNPSEAEEAARRLARIGFDAISGFAPEVVAASATGEKFESLPAVDFQTVQRRLAGLAEDWTLLDVRSQDEIDRFGMPGATTIYVGDLPARIGELEARRHITVMCASGVRAALAASYLRMREFPRIDVFLGSAGAWEARHA